MQGQQNDKYTEIHGQQYDKYTEIHGQQILKNELILFFLILRHGQESGLYVS